MKVLVVEDDPVIRRILEDLLTRWQYEVEVTTNGEQAMKALQHESPPASPSSTGRCPGWTELSFAAGPAIS
ncbi:MAG: response regulator [Verrucomicrobiia bacterium]